MTGDLRNDESGGTPDRERGIDRGPDERREYDAASLKERDQADPAEPTAPGRRRGVIDRVKHAWNRLRGD